MQFPKWNQSENLSTTSKKPLNPTLEQTLHNFQNHCSGFLPNLSKTLQHHHHDHHHLNLPFLNPNSSTFKPHFQFSLDNFISQAKQTFERSLRRKPPVWARISSQNETLVEPVHRFDIALSNVDFADRLAGVSVYAVTNSDKKLFFLSGDRAEKKPLAFFCFSKKDVKALLEELKPSNPELRRGLKIGSLPLNKVFQLKNMGASFRFIPDSSQIMNAVKVKQNAGASDVGITGVPVFQSQSLILRSENKTYRPFFFRKEDLDKSLRIAAQYQNQLNPALRKGDIKVSVLEDIITTMQESSTSKWDDVVFIPPGFDVTTVIPQKERLTVTG